MSTCKSCDAPIRWARTDAGKAIPLDPDPVDNGNLVLTHLEPGAGEDHVRYLTKGEVPPALAPRYVSHFATCPDGPAWRNRR